MKIQTSTTDLSVSTMLNNEVVQHTMAKDSINLQMLMLRTGLYSDKVKAVVREYLTNARDAHIEAGHKLPVDITIPNRFGNELVIRDYGPGMSPEFIKSVYVQYTASTKRDTNELTGGWGIGSKSAYAYADSFTVVSIHDGVAYTWLAQSFSDGSGSFTLVSQSETEEPSGVAIRIALAKTEDSIRFTNATRFYSGFIDVPVRINGSLIESSDDSPFGKTEEAAFYLKIAPGSNSRYNKKIFIVQGGVPYPVDLDLVTDALEEEVLLLKTLSYYYFSSDLCIEVPLGTFMPDISREKIQFDASGETLNKIVDLAKKADKFFKDVSFEIMNSLSLTNYDLLRIVNGDKVSVVEEAISERCEDKIFGPAKKYLESNIFKYFSQLNSSQNSTLLNPLNMVDSITDFKWVSNYPLSVKNCYYSSFTKYLSQGPSDVMIFVSNTDYKRKQRLSAENTESYRSNFYIKIEKDVSYEDFLIDLKKAFSDSSCVLNGLDFSKVNIKYLEPANSVSRASKGRRATKFLLVTDIDYNNKIEARQIKPEEVETEKTIVYGLTFRGNLVDEQNQAFSIRRRAIQDLISSNDFELRVIKYSEWKKNKSLTRNKIDFSSLINIIDFNNFLHQLAYYTVNISSFNTMLEILDEESTPKSILEIIESIRSDIESTYPTEELNEFGLTRDSVWQFGSSNNASLDKSLVNISERVGSTFPMWTKLKSFLNSHCSFWHGDDEMLLKAVAEMPHLFETQLPI